MRATYGKLNFLQNDRSNNKGKAEYSVFMEDYGHPVKCRERQN